jgi:hypothetical protein
MDTTLLEKQFARMGARLKVNVRPTIRRFRFTGFAVDIGRDGHRAFFDVTLGETAERKLEGLDLQPGQRHLPVALLCRARGKNPVYRSCLLPRQRRAVEPDVAKRAMMVLHWFSYALT